MRIARRSLVTALAVVVAALALGVASAPAAQPRFSLDEISTELMCPECGTRLDLSNSPAANQIRDEVRRLQAEGRTKEQVKDQLVEEFGPRILAAPPRSGFGGLAWLVPALVGLAGAAAAVAAAVVWRRRGAARGRDGGRDGDADDGLDPELRRRLDEAVARFDA